jgi:hypothetical protein
MRFLGRRLLVMHPARPAYLPTIHGLDERAPAEDVITAAKVYALTTLRFLGKEQSC